MARAEGARQGGQRALKAVARIWASTLSEKGQPLGGFEKIFLASGQRRAWG